MIYDCFFGEIQIAGLLKCLLSVECICLCICNLQLTFFVVKTKSRGSGDPPYSIISLLLIFIRYGFKGSGICIKADEVKVHASISSIFHLADDGDTHFILAILLSELRHHLASTQASGATRSARRSLTTSPAPSR